MQSSGIQTFCLRGTSCHRLEDFKAVEWSSWLGEVPEDWKGADITHIFKEGKKEGPGKYKPVRLTLVPGNILLERISTHMRIRRWLGSIHQNGFAKGKSCLTKPITFHDEVTDWMDEERAAEVVYLHFSKDFDAVCHDIIMVAADEVWVREVGSDVDWKLSEQPGSEDKMMSNLYSGCSILGQNCWPK